MNAYEVLGIQPTRNVKAIKAAYRKAVKTWHPDVCKKPEAIEMIKKVNLAFEEIMRLLKQPTQPPRVVMAGYSYYYTGTSATTSAAGAYYQFYA